MNNEQWTVNSEQWTANSEQWTVNSEKWTVNSGQWTADIEQWSVNSEQWTVNIDFSCDNKNLYEIECEYSLWNLQIYMACYFAAVFGPSVNLKI